MQVLWEKLQSSFWQKQALQGCVFLSCRLGV